MEQLRNAVDLLKKINSFGYESYIVGGAPRDLSMGLEPKDIDIATNCPIEILQKKFETYEIGQSKAFGLILVMYKSFLYEVAQFRKEAEYDGFRPKKVKLVKSIEIDVYRRDFTVNALVMNADGNIIDYVGSHKDISKKIIRTVGDPHQRFEEDYVRMIRAARFASMDGFSIETYTRRAIRQQFRNINYVKPERIRIELIKAAEHGGKRFAQFILLLDDLKLLAQILPEVAATKYFRHDLHHHPEGPTVFTHSIECLKIMKYTNPIGLIATLLHDIGKCIAFQEDKYWWKFTYHGHASVGARMAVDIARRLKFNVWNTNEIEYAIKNHMKFHNILDMKPSKIARIVNSPHFEILKEVAWADEFSRGEAFAYYGEFDTKMKRINDIKEKWENKKINSTVKIVDGNRIMMLLNLKPGPEVGKIKKDVEDYIIDNGLEPTSDLIDELISKFGEQDVTI